MNNITFTLSFMNNTESLNNKVSDTNDSLISMRNMIYVDINEFDPVNLIIRQGRKIMEHDLQTYEIFYKYTQGSFTDRFNLLAKDLVMKQNRKGVILYGNKCNVPLDEHQGTYSDVDRIIRLIRSKVISYIRTNTQNATIESEDPKYLNIEMMRHGKMCKIIKLGSRGENNVNTEIKTIEQFNSLLMDYRYNKRSTESYYKADIFISFRSCVYVHKPNSDPETGQPIQKNQRISFIPCAKMMELRYNKANCISVIDHDDKVMIKDNVLVL